MKILDLKLLILLLMVTGWVSAQQLTHPMKFVVNAPSSIAGNYSYGYQTDWGPTVLDSTVTGELAWGFNATDSLACAPITTNLTGKVALIRRGDCTFSLKTYHAQQQGAIGCIICTNVVGGGTINMSGGDSATAVTIPSILLSWNDCELLHTELDNGSTVNVSFFKPSIFDPIGIWSYQTPQSQIQAIPEMAISLLNTDTTIASTVTAELTVRDPSGTATTFNESAGSMNPNDNVQVIFTGPYTPVDTGVYEMAYKTSLDANDSIVRNFEVSNYTFALDEGNADNGVGISDADFATGGYRFDMGASYLAGSNGGAATFASFALANPELYFGEQFTFLLYQVPTNYTGQETDYTGFDPVGAGSYNITAVDTMNPNSLMTTKLVDINNGADSVVLDQDSLYMLVIRYFGSGSITVCPRFSFSGTDEYLGLGETVFTDRLYMGGFVGGYKPVVRMHMNGFNGPAGVAVREDLGLNAAITLFPNPAVDQVTIDLQFAEMANEVQLDLINIQGQILQQQQLTNVQQNQVSWNTTELPAGTYFIRISTDKGYDIKELVKR